MNERATAPWLLRCNWCEWNITVNARGAHGDDPGSGVEAARLMENHVIVRHGKTWTEYLSSAPPADPDEPYESWAALQGANLDAPFPEEGDAA